MERDVPSVKFENAPSSTSENHSVSELSGDDLEIFQLLGEAVEDEEDLPRELVESYQGHPNFFIRKLADKLLAAATVGGTTEDASSLYSDSGKPAGLDDSGAAL